MNAFDGRGCWVRPITPEEMHRSPYVAPAPRRDLACPKCHALFDEERCLVKDGEHCPQPWRAKGPLPPPTEASPANLIWLLSGFMMGALGTLLIFGVLML